MYVPKEDHLYANTVSYLMYISIVHILMDRNTCYDTWCMYVLTGSIVIETIPSQSSEVTEMVELTCEADGYRSEQFGYQWRINGTNIDGATDKVFTILSVSEGDSGTYECVVTNHWNDMNTSNPAQLIITSK